MQRREFVTLLSGAAVAWPMAARGQRRTLPVIGILSSTTADGFAPRTAAFMQGLKEAGFVEGLNLAIEYRWADDQYDRLPDMAADLVRRRVSLIAAIGNNLTALAAKSVTTTIPIVFTKRRRPRANRPCCQPQQARWKYHRRHEPSQRQYSKATATAARPCPQRQRVWAAR